MRWSAGVPQYKTSALRLILALLMLTAGCSVWAGYYAVTFSGGTSQENDGFGNVYTLPYGQSGETCEGHVNSDAAPGFGSCTGDLKASFQWATTTGEPAPAEVWVCEYIFTHWQNVGGGDDGACTDGSSADTEKKNLGPESSGASYRIVWTRITNPGTNFSRTITGAQVDVDGTSTWGTYGEVQYQVHTIGVNGVSLSGGNQAGGYLVGQLCEATLPTYEMTPGGYFGKAAWVVGGCSPFKAFAVDFVGGANVATGNEVLLGSADLNGTTSLSCCFAGPAGAAGLAITLNFTGDLNGDPNPPTYSYPYPASATVAAPTVALNFTKGTVGLVSSTGTVTGVGVLNPVGQSGATLGTQWNAVVLTPAGYGGNGGWQFIQILTIATKRTFNGLSQVQKCHSLVKGVYSNFTSGMDTTDPYDPLNAGPPVGPYFWPADGQKQGNAADDPLDSFDPGMTSEVVQEDFQDYLMFLAPGVGSQLVPLQSFNWGWKASVSLNLAGQWGWDPNAASPNPIIYLNPPAIFPPFPIWMNLIKAGNFVWV